MQNISKRCQATLLPHAHPVSDWILGKRNRLFREALEDTAAS